MVPDSEKGNDLFGYFTFVKLNKILSNQIQAFGLVFSMRKLKMIILLECPKFTFVRKQLKTAMFDCRDFLIGFHEHFR